MMQHTILGLECDSIAVFLLKLALLSHEFLDTKEVHFVWVSFPKIQNKLFFIVAEPQLMLTAGPQMMVPPPAGAAAGMYNAPPQPGYPQPGYPGGYGM